LTELLIADANGSYHVIIEPVTMHWSTCESQIATETLRLRDQGSQQAHENKAKRYGEHLLRRFRKKLAKQLQDITFQFKAQFNFAQYGERNFDTCLSQF